MSKTIDKITGQIQDATDCSLCVYRIQCDRTPLKNAWRDCNKRCSLWRAWNGK